jgi:HEAT repeat protein
MNQPGKMAAQNRQIDSLSSQISEMKEIMMLSLLQDQSASRRIQAVSYTEDMTSLDKKISDALFTTLNEDTNVNVRLATLEALAKMADSPVVREGLIRSIALQNSPIMQSAIADVMVRLHEKKSVGQLRQLLERQDLNQMVKVNIEKSIQQLI